MKIISKMLPDGMSRESIFLPFSNNILEARRMHMVAETEKDSNRVKRNCFTKKIHAENEICLRSLVGLQTIRCSGIKKKWATKNLKYDTLHPVYFGGSKTLNLKGKCPDCVMLKKLNRVGNIEYVKIWMFDNTKASIMAFFFLESKENELKRKSKGEIVEIQEGEKQA